jgi:hypothetical protein
MCVCDCTVVGCCIATRAAVRVVPLSLCVSQCAAVRTLVWPRVVCDGIAFMLWVPSWRRRGVWRSSAS